MPKSLSLFLVLLLVIKSYSQDKLSSYKEITDRAISSYFDKSLLDSISCIEVSSINLDGNREWFPNYDSYKNDTIKFKTVTFLYSFFSKNIDYYFDFKVTIDKNKIIEPDSILFTKIPKCISTNTECNFIKKDQAILLAKADSIDNPENLSIKFIRPFNKSNYYWIITGYPNENPANKVRRTTARKISPRQRKVIEALSGKIITWEEYSK